MRAKMIAVLLIVLVAAAAIAQRVSVTYKHGKSFAEYHTYTWGNAGQNQIANSILAQEARKDINAELQAKGLRMVEEHQNPDLIVTATSGGRSDLGEITPEQNVEGTLVVDLHDSKLKEVVWRGIAPNTLNSNGNKNQKEVQNAVNKMFKQWPKG